MTEELALDEFGGDGGAVDLDERPVTAWAELMQLSGHQLLASAVLASDEDPGAGRRHLLNHVTHLHHRCGGADHLVLTAHNLLQGLVLCAQVALVQGVAYRDEQPVHVGRLHDEVESAFLDGVHGIVDGAVAGDHDHGYVIVLLDVLQHLDAVHLGHLDVAQHGIVFLLFHHLYGRGASVGVVDLIVFVLQDLTQHATDGVLVVDNQYS